MKTAKLMSYTTITHAVTKNSCPVCEALREVQSLLVERPGGRLPTNLCNYHGWLFARAAPADVAAGVFRNLLQLWKEAKTVAAVRCEFCQKVRNEEKAVLAEFAEHFTSPVVAELMQERGTICLAHVIALSTGLPALSQGIVAQIVARNARDLDADLAAFAKIAETGHHVGGGVLGHAAEFLFSQRGISHEEAPCSNRDRRKR